MDADLCFTSASELARLVASRALSPVGFTYHWNLAGAPAIALPWGLGDAGLPGSVQLIGPVGADGRVLSVAAAIETPLPRPPEPA